MKIAIIINAKRMTEALRDQLKSQVLAEKYQLTYDLFEPEPEEIEKVVQSINFSAYNACLVGGGDGTVRSVVELLIDQSIPLIILPLGTFNVLAKDLTYPNDIDEIFKIIKNNKTKQIDLSEVNGKIIINHAWIGFYYSVLKRREKYKDTLGKNKFLKTIFNLYNIFKVLPSYHLTFKTDEKERDYKTCLVYVGNNPSHTNPLDFGDRKTLTSGRLAVTILKCMNRWQLLLNMLSIPFNQFNDSKYVMEFQTDTLTITARSNLVNVVIDGELFKLESPLHFINHQKQLTVFTV